MIYEVTNLQKSVKIYPESELEEIAQNIRTILLTPKFSVPLDRKLGVNYVQIDEPITAEQSRMTAEIVSAVSEFEPRAKVTEVLYETDEIGKLKITVRFYSTE